ncbi:MAG: chromosome partitioning protein ParB [Janthinobacterium lividum]
MSIRRTRIGARPVANPRADAWIKESVRADAKSFNPHTARLTLDVTPVMRTRIKIEAFRNGITVSQLLRTLLEQAFPEKVE